MFVINLEPLARGVSSERFTVPPYRLEGKLFLESPPGGSLSFANEGTLAPPAVRQ